MTVFIKAVKTVLIVFVVLACAASFACVKEEFPPSFTMPVTFQDPVSEIPTTTPAPTTEDEPSPTPSPTEKPTEAPAQDYSGGIARDKATLVPLYPSTGEKKPFCGTGHTLAVQFYATTEFTSVGFESPTWTAKDGYSVDYSLFKWNNDYYDTIYGDSLVEGSYEDWADGANVPLDCGTLPAGEYLLVAMYRSEETMKNSGVWYMDSECEKQRSYLDDEVWYDVSICFNIRYTKTPVNKYGPFSDSGLD